MAEGKHCYFCGKKATVHFTQILNNKILKMDLCESCAKQHGIGDAAGLGLGELLSKTGLFSDDTPTEVTCPQCGFSLNEPQFKNMGRLGCPHCYDEFHATLSSVLKDLHPQQAHKGKSPHNLLGRQATREKMKKLEQEMQLAIKAENYEKAAALRDEIAALKESLRGLDKNSGQKDS